MIDTVCVSAPAGTVIEVPTLDGREDLDVPPGTQPGEAFTLRGRGMPHIRRRGTGDLVVQVLMDSSKKGEMLEFAGSFVFLLNVVFPYNRSLFQADDTHGHQ